MTKPRHVDRRGKAMGHIRRWGKPGIKVFFQGGRPKYLSFDI
jgi:hypothetical protein